MWPDDRIHFEQSGRPYYLELGCRLCREVGFFIESDCLHTGPGRNRASDGNSLRRKQFANHQSTSTSTLTTLK